MMIRKIVTPRNLRWTHSGGGEGTRTRTTRRNTITTAGFNRSRSRSITTTATTTGTTEDELDIKNVLQQVRDGAVSIETAQTILQSLSSSLLPSMNNDDITSSFATLDYYRYQRTNFPEVVFGQNKTPDNILKLLTAIATRQIQLYHHHYYHMTMIRNQQQQQQIEGHATSSTSSVHHIDYTVTPHGINLLPPAIATRVDPQMYDEICKEYSLLEDKNGHLEYSNVSRLVVYRPFIPDEEAINNDLLLSHATTTITTTTDDNKNDNHPRVVIVTAGTTDIPVAKEAGGILSLSSSRTCPIVVEYIHDVGVAGLHRIINALPKLTHRNVKCIIVCAGMDGALPSVVGGLVRVPVIAVPTSIGYGAAFQGISPLLTMLNSCAPGVAVMNIDNGFGAAAFAYKMIRSIVPSNQIPAKS